VQSVGLKLNANKLKIALAIPQTFTTFLPVATNKGESLNTK